MRMSNTTTSKIRSSRSNRRHRHHLGGDMSVTPPRVVKRRPVVGYGLSCRFGRARQRFLLLSPLIPLLPLLLQV